MGGATLPQVVEFRGIYTDAETAALLDELARISGPVYVDPIAGCGSFQGQAVRLPDGRIITLGSTAQSAETHTGDGVVDLNCEHLTDAEAHTLETLLRSLGCAAWFRPAVSPYTGNAYGWQRHIHLIRTDAANLPDAARRQVTAYRNRLDGLAVPHADRGSHAYLSATWAAYRKELDMPLTDEDVQRIAKAAAAQVWTVKWTSPSNGKPYRAADYLIVANSNSHKTVAALGQVVSAVKGIGSALVKIAAQVAGVDSKAQVIASREALDTAAVTAAASSAAVAAAGAFAVQLHIDEPVPATLDDPAA